MKKLFLLLIIPILLCGCEKKDSKEKIETPKTNKTTESITTTSSRTTTTTTTSTTATSKKTTTKSKTTTSKLNTNEYISTADGKVHKYSYVYSDEETCNENCRRETPYDDISRYEFYAFLGCEEIKDENGKSFWGIYYLKSTDANSKFYY